MLINEYEISAIIGMWRMGASDYEIAGVMMISIDQVRRAIRDYQMQLKKASSASNNSINFFMSAT
jgi:hypothetical protein